MATYTIAQAQPEDYGTIAEIYNQAIQQGNASMEETEKTAESIAGWVAGFHNRERLYVLRDAEGIQGWGILKRYSDREGYRFAAETAVYLWQNQARKGYGSALKKHLIVEARSLEYHHLVAKIFAINTGSIQYNLKLGYTIVGTQKEVGWKDGQWMDIVIMQLILS